MIKGPKDRCSSKNNKTILKVQAIHCPERNSDRDGGHEISVGGNSTKFDASLQWATLAMLLLIALGRVDVLEVVATACTAAAILVGS
jgi:hypothetical protein